MCQANFNGGTYWLSISSAVDHNYILCTGYQLQADNLDAIFASGPNVDRRCVSDNDYASSEGAVVGVYSSSSAADVAAARDFCAEAGWSNN